MNDIFKDKLSIIANDDLLIKSLRSLFDEIVERERPTINEVDNNNTLGEKYRAYELSKRIIELGFINLQALKNLKQQVVKFNKER